MDGENEVTGTVANATPPQQHPKTKLKEIPLKNIRESKVALRDVDKSDEQYIGLVDSIRGRGVLNPILVRELGKEDGEMYYSLVDGLQRFNASQDAGRETIPAQIIEMSDAQVLEAQIIANIHRVETKPVQYSKQLQKILSENPFMTLTDLANRLAKSPAWLNDRLGLTKLTEDIGELVDSGKIALSNGYVLAKLPPEEQVNFVERAMTQQPSEFAPQVNNRVKEIKEAKRQGRDASAESFIPVPFMQKIGVIKQEMETPQALLHLLETQKPKNPMESAKITLAWVLHLDPISVEEAKTKYEEKKKADAEAKQKRDKEKLAKKTLAARTTAQELLAKAEQEGIDLDEEQARLATEAEQTEPASAST
jgi:ParB/RepB/Spo0J family partition protein